MTDKERAERKEQAIRTLVNGLTKEGVLGIEFDDKCLQYRTNGYKVIIEPKVHVDTKK